MNAQTITLRYITFVVIAIMAFGISVFPASANHGGAEEEGVSHSETAEHDDEDAAEDEDHGEDTHSDDHIMHASTALNADQVKALVALLTQLIDLLKQQKAMLPS